MTPHQKKLGAYQASNLECARIVLSDVAKYGGPESLMVMWARLVVANATRERVDEKELPLWRAA